MTRYSIIDDQILNNNGSVDFFEAPTDVTSGAATFSASKVKKDFLGGGSGARANEVIGVDRTALAAGFDDATEPHAALRELASRDRQPKESNTTSLFEEEAVPDIQWDKPDILHSDLGEILRTAERFAKKPQEKTSIAVRIYQSLADGRLEDLTDDLWSVLENTDSFRISKGDFEKVRELSDQYGRDVDSKINRIREGLPISAPTIAILDNIPHKVGGNTRLMIARAMGITPKVMIARLDSGIPPEELPEIDEEPLRRAIMCYEQLCRPNKDRASFNQAYAQLSGIDENSTYILKKIGDIYYGFDHTPTLEEFVVTVVRKGII